METEETELNSDTPPASHRIGRFDWQDKWKTVATSLEEDQVRLLGLLCDITGLTKSKLIRAAVKHLLNETLGLNEDPAKIRAHWDSLPLWSKSQKAEEFRHVVYNLRKQEVK